MLARRDKYGRILCWNNVCAMLDISLYTSAIGKNNIIKAAR